MLIKDYPHNEDYFHDIVTKMVRRLSMSERRLFICKAINYFPELKLYIREDNGEIDLLEIGVDDAIHVLKELGGFDIEELDKLLEGREQRKSYKQLYT
ncbi:MAG: hypothetical protein KDK36_05795 [Leptospiraceae bacterium]|nr:hypothetical protein [Leptospiraceae bacterium]